MRVRTPTGLYTAVAKMKRQPTRRTPRSLNFRIKPTRLQPAGDLVTLLRDWDCMVKFDAF